MSAETSPATSKRIAGVEVRSIDYVPLNERHGKVWSQGPLWFMSNAQIATLAVGTFSVVGGGNLVWSLLAIVAGALLGTCFMAFHAAQGPQLGLPQMIQSRPQFGHGRSAGFRVVFGSLTVAVFTRPFPAGSFDLGGFKATPFLVQFGAVAGYQISWAIYVSDYSRYLPPDVTVRRTVLWTYWGSAVGGAWMMIVGVFLAAWAGKTFDFTGIAELDQVGDHVFTGFGAVVLILAALGLVSVTALNMYGGSLTLISAIDSFKKVRPTLSVRVITIGFTAV